MPNGQSPPLVPGAMEHPTLVLGALIDHVTASTLSARTADAGAYPVAHLASRLPRTWWQHPEAVGTIDIDLGQPRDVGTVFVGDLNLGPQGEARFWTSATSSPAAVRHAPTALVESTNLSGTVADINGDPTNPPSSTGAVTTGVVSSFTVAFPTPTSLLGGGQYHVARLLLAEAPGSPDIATTLEEFRVLDGSTSVAVYAPSVPTLPGPGYHELRFSSDDLVTPDGSDLRVHVELRTLGGSTTVVAVDLALTPATAGPPVVIPAWPTGRTQHAGTLATQADSWPLPLDVAHHLRTADGAHGNMPMRYLRVDLDNSTTGQPVEAGALLAGPSLFLGAQPGLEYGGTGEGPTLETPAGLDMLLPARGARGDKVSVAVGVDSAEAIRELLTLRLAEEPFIVHPTPLRPRTWSMPYLAHFAERPQVVNQSIGLVGDRDRYGVSFDFREIRR